MVLPNDMSSSDSVFALEPCTDAPSVRSLRPREFWPPPSIIRSISRMVRIPNLTNEPRVLKRQEQFCQIRPVYIPEYTKEHPGGYTETSSPKVKCTLTSPSGHATTVTLDPDNMFAHSERSKFWALLEQYDEVFDPVFQGYNGAAGPFEAVVNMGPAQPPQRKGRLPQYAYDKLCELQHKFDDLEKLGAFGRPEDMGITVEYLNPSFLIKKPNGGFRLVTAFADVGRYSEPQPSIMPNVDSILRKISQ